MESERTYSYVFPFTNPFDYEAMEDWLLKQRSLFAAKRGIDVGIEGLVFWWLHQPIAKIKVKDFWKAQRG